MTNSSESTLALVGSYTIGMLVDVVDFWTDLLQEPVSIALGDYGQVFQQILSPSSVLGCNRKGGNVVALRWEDLCSPALAARASELAWDDVRPHVEEVVSAVTCRDHEVPLLLVVGPSRPDVPALEKATDELVRGLAEVANVYVVRGGDAMQRYAVRGVFDTASDRFGHVPYTPEALAALGTSIARWYAALVRRPVKAFAVDADHTLWSGVVGEDGVDGVRVDAGHERLQAMLAEQATRGRLLCLLSKNDESDVAELFRRRRGLRLGWGDFSARRVNWNPKPANLLDMANELELAASGFVFLDDNPVECAAMRAERPEVTTVRVPIDGTLASFVEHLWLFDQPKVTSEDRQRVRLYRDNAARAEMRETTASLRDFLARLELVVDLEPATAADIARLAQLSQRTNQFNASFLRCDEANIRAGLADGAIWHRLVRVRDRFGDYGIVGQVRMDARRPVPTIDLFMLSCRVLGRGVEHRMFAAAGAFAASMGRDAVELSYRPGERNTPLRQFVKSLVGDADLGAEQQVRFASRDAAALVFDADALAPPADEPQALTPRPPSAQPDGASAIHERIATQLTTGRAITRAMASRTRARPDLANPYVGPAGGLARGLATIWQEVLRIDRVGAFDRFADLGGKSLHLVHVHRAMLDRLGVDVEITTLFQHATVASLAAHLDGLKMAKVTKPNDDPARRRAQDMRAARARAAARFGATP